ncbi:MAG: 3-hydroxyacyl-ACP dehydratase FabZ [Chloroflexota bacterium]|jgi:3-hydroxyacyl-[acyl-carrier-protein] dehydratase
MIPLLDRAGIEALIPHRAPFLLVDRVLSDDRAAQVLVAELDVRADAFWTVGHFPGMPIMPGVLQVEALAQAMALYVARTEGFGTRLGLFAKIEECRFTRMVVPGETLRLEVTMQKLGSRMGSAKGVASVGGEPACSATITFVIPPEGALPRPAGQ